MLNHLLMTIFSFCKDLKLLEISKINRLYCFSKCKFKILAYFIDWTLTKRVSHLVALTQTKFWVILRQTLNNQPKSPSLRSLAKILT